jgi:4-hydroxy-3-methylbut-2-enyl diphosphate reductase
LSSSLLLLTPLRVEAFCARRGAPASRVVRTGMGRDRSLAAPARLVPVGSGPAVVLGLGGGLVAGQQPGDVVVADEVSLAPGADEEGRTVSIPFAYPLAGALRSAGLRVSTGTVVSTPRLERGAAARAACGAGGALAVDMESWWLVGSDPLRPAVVRVLLDVPGRELVSVRTAPALRRSFRVLVQVARTLESWCAALTPSPTEVPS